MIVRRKVTLRRRAGVVAQVARRGGRVVAGLVEDEERRELVVRSVEFGAGGLAVRQTTSACSQLCSSESKDILVSWRDPAIFRCHRVSRIPLAPSKRSDGLVGDECRDLVGPLLPQVPILLIDLGDIAAEWPALLRRLSCRQRREILRRDRGGSRELSVDAVHADVPARVALAPGREEGERKRIARKKRGKVEACISFLQPDHCGCCSGTETYRKDALEPLTGRQSEGYMSAQRSANAEKVNLTSCPRLDKRPQSQHDARAEALRDA